MTGTDHEDGPQPVVDGDLSIEPAATAAILERFLKVELERTGLERLVLGLSGGIDSAVAAYLAVRALGDLLALVHEDDLVVIVEPLQVVGDDHDDLFLRELVQRVAHTFGGQPVQAGEGLVDDEHRCFA